jgi:hypothetical protein
VTLLRLVGGLALLCTLGTGVLLLTGVWRECSGALRLLVATFAGTAAAVVVLPWFVYLRLAPSAPLVAILATVTLVGGVVLERRRRPSEPAPLRRAFTPLQLAWVTAPFIVLAVRGFTTVSGAYDAFSNWVLKAKLLYFGGDMVLGDQIFHAAFTTNGSLPVERAYPLGLPSLDAFAMNAMGTPSLRLLHGLFVLMLAGFAALCVLVLRPHVAPWLLAGGVSFVAWMPALRDQALSANADVVLACFWVAAALLLWHYLSAAHPGHLLLAALFAAAAVATKREGAVFVAALWGLVLVAGTGLRRPIVAAGLAVAVTAVPWRLFVAVHDLGGHDVQPSDWRVGDHVEELPLVLRELGQRLVDDTYLGAVPLAVVAAILLLRHPLARRAAVGYLALTALLLVTLIGVYVNTRVDALYLLNTSADRTLVTPSLLAAVLLPLLLAYRFGAEQALSSETSFGGRRPERDAPDEDQGPRAHRGEHHVGRLVARALGHRAADDRAGNGAGRPGQVRKREAERVVEPGGVGAVGHDRRPG